VLLRPSCGLVADRDGTAPFHHVLLITRVEIMRRALSLLVMTALSVAVASSLWVALDARQDLRQLEVQLKSVREEVRQGDVLVAAAIGRSLRGHNRSINDLESRLDRMERESWIESRSGSGSEGEEADRLTAQLQSLNQEVRSMCWTLERELDLVLFCG